VTPRDGASTMAEHAPERRLPSILVSILAVSIALVALHGAVRWYGKPFGGLLVDPDATVSSIGLPTWSGIRAGLRFPDEIVAVDGHPRVARPGRHRAEGFAEAIEHAARAGRKSVTVDVRSRGEVRSVEVEIRPLDPLAWWLYGGATIVVGALYVLAALIAIGASPDGRLARTFTKTALLSALFLFAFFDYHTSRDLVPLMDVAFGMAPFAFVALALRLPDDVPFTVRHPWVFGALDLLGASLALSMVARHLAGETTIALRAFCSVIFGLAILFFVVCVLVRFALATGSRRQILATLIGAIGPPHALVGAGILMSLLDPKGSTVAFFFLPALALTPLATMVAFIRHDIWGSRSLLSRFLTRAVIAATTCGAAIALATALAAALGVSFADALLAATASGVASATLVHLALGASDRGLFPSRAKYKPTIDQLSEELTAIDSPHEVSNAIERTVRRWLDCERVEVVEHEPTDGASPTIEARQLETSAWREGTPDGAHGPPGNADLEVPIAFRGRALATLRVARKRGGALFTTDDVDLLRTIANQGALALAHAHHYAELEMRRLSQAAAWRDERLALVETVAAEIAHEIRYPINFFRSVFARKARGAELDDEEIDIGREEVERLERLVAGLRRMVGSRLERRPVPLLELVGKAEMLLRDNLGARRVEVCVPDALVLRCAPDQVTQVLVNLLANAVDATGPRDRLGVEWRPRSRGGDLVVWDRGPGFEGDGSHLFAPWFTTKARGTGLGLAITHRLVRAHGWSIDAMRDGGRTLFVISIPQGDVVDSSTLRAAEVEAS
jgi:signal transduction histidine kinase